MQRGFKYRNIDSSTYHITVKTDNIPVIPAKRIVQEEVIGRDGSYIFEDKHSPKEIELTCELHGHLKYSERRYLVREITAWLDIPGELILNYEPDKKYQAHLSEQTDLSMLAVYDVFTLVFVVQPIAKSIYENDGLTWGEAAIPWGYASIPWGGYQTVFQNITGDTTVDVTNAGTYDELPVIVLSGEAASITITDDAGNSFTYTNLVSGTDIYIDCKNKLVYSISGSSKVNKRSYFTGDYIKLLPGTNSIDISGTITSVNIDFDYRNAYL